MQRKVVSSRKTAAGLSCLELAEPTSGYRRWWLKRQSVDGLVVALRAWCAKSSVEIVSFATLLKDMYQRSAILDLYAIQVGVRTEVVLRI